MVIWPNTEYIPNFQRIPSFYPPIFIKEIYVQADGMCVHVCVLGKVWFSPLHFSSNDTIKLLDDYYHLKDNNNN